MSRKFLGLTLGLACALSACQADTGTSGQNPSTMPSSIVQATQTAGASAQAAVRTAPAPSSARPSAEPAQTARAFYDRCDLASFINFSWGRLAPTQSSLAVFVVLGTPGKECTYTGAANPYLVLVCPAGYVCAIKDPSTVTVSVTRGHAREEGIRAQVWIISSALSLCDLYKEVKQLVQTGKFPSPPYNSYPAKDVSPLPECDR